MNSSLKRVLPALAAIVLTFGLAGCGDDDGSDASGSSDHSDGSGGGGGGGGGGEVAADSPEAAYTAFAEAIRDDDVDAFDTAVHDGYWSDLTEERNDNEANLAIHHWEVANGVMTLPEDAKALVGDDVFGPDTPAGTADDYAKRVAKMLHFDALTGDDLALVSVADGYDTGLANEAQGENCVEDDTTIEECLGDEAAPGARESIDIILVRGDDGWKVFGTEPSH